MNQDQFWQIISDSRSSFFVEPYTPNQRGMFEGVMDHQAEELKKILSGLPPEQIADFHRMFRFFTNVAYDWDLWAAAFLLGGGCSDDSFYNFRWWLISMGKNVYEAAIKDPDSLALCVPRKDVEDFFFEEIGCIATDTYEDLTGREMPMQPFVEQREPRGKRFSEDMNVLKARFPRIAAALYAPS